VASHEKISKVSNRIMVAALLLKEAGKAFIDGVMSNIQKSQPLAQFYGEQKFVFTEPCCKENLMWIARLKKDTV
jgi:hypothetical protein